MFRFIFQIKKQITRNKKRHMEYTPVEDAFHFNTTMPIQTKSRFSPTCIYCMNEDSIVLLKDGSFRQCRNPSCRKQFAARLVTQFNNETSNRSVQQRLRHPNEYIMFQPRECLKQPPPTHEKQGPSPVETRLGYNFSSTSDMK